MVHVNRFNQYAGRVEGQRNSEGDEDANAVAGNDLAPRRRIPAGEVLEQDHRRCESIGGIFRRIAEDVGGACLAMAYSGAVHGVVHYDPQGAK